MNSGEWTCLISFATAPLTCSERGGSEKFKMKIYVSSGIRTHTPPVHDRKVVTPRSEQVNGAVANEIKHVHSPEVIVVLDPRYDLSYKALYISTYSIALIKLQMPGNTPLLLLMSMSCIDSNGQWWVKSRSCKIAERPTFRHVYTYNDSLMVHSIVSRVILENDHKIGWKNLIIMYLELIFSGIKMR